MEYSGVAYSDLAHAEETVSWTDFSAIPSVVWTGQSVDRGLADGSTPAVWNASAGVAVVVCVVGVVCSRLSAISMEEAGI